MRHDAGAVGTVSFVSKAESEPLCGCVAVLFVLSPRNPYTVVHHTVRDVDGAQKLNFSTIVSPM